MGSWVNGLVGSCACGLMDLWTEGLDGKQVNW